MGIVTYDGFTINRANTFLGKLNIAQKTKLNELCILINGNITRSAEVESLYHEFTGNLLEPIVARYWIHEAIVEEEEQSPVPEWYD